LIVTPKDFAEFFCTLQNTSANQQLVNNIIYGFIRDCSWLGKVVDVWLVENIMVVRQMHVTKKI
jgi:hypothetical protein